FVSEAPSQHLGAAVVTVEARLRDEDLDRAVGHWAIVPSRPLLLTAAGTVADPRRPSEHAAPAPGRAPASTAGGGPLSGVGSTECPGCDPDRADGEGGREPDPQRDLRVAPVAVEQRPGRIDRMGQRIDRA